MKTIRQHAYNQAQIDSNHAEEMYLFYCEVNDYSNAAREWLRYQRLIHVLDYLS